VYRFNWKVVESGSGTGSVMLTVIGSFLFSIFNFKILLNSVTLSSSWTNFRTVGFQAISTYWTDTYTYTLFHTHFNKA